MKPLVSVVLPSYKHAAFVGAAIRSVLGQTLQDLELIVVDDASPDDSWSIIQAETDPRMRSQRHESNQGAHATINEALALARGEYVAILNSDDLFEPRRLEILIEAMRAENAGLGFSDLHFIDPAGARLDEHPRAQEHADTAAWCATRSASTWFLAGNLAVTTSNFVFHRDMLSVVGGFLPLRYTHDWAWALAIATCRRLCWVREPLLQYRVHPANTLAEDDRWRHVHENAFVQTFAVERLDRIRSVQAPQGDDADDLLAALFRNRSAPPLTTLALLSMLRTGTTEAELLEMTDQSAGNWLAPTVAAASGLPEEVFLSSVQLAGHLDALRGQATMLEERWQAMQEMSLGIAQRDEALVAQKTLIVERWNTIQQMKAEIARRDETIAHQTQQIENGAVANASQARMLDERYAAMQEMGRNIFERDQLLDSARGEVAQKSAEVAELSARLDHLLKHPVIRATRALRRLLKPGRD